MEVDEIQQEVCKFQKVCSNGSNNQKIATSTRGNLVLKNHVDDGRGVGDAQFYGWPASRIVRVSRASGGKDRHSKVLTSKGLRDRRMRLAVGTAIQFYDLQDRLGYDQPSKVVEWLLKAASSSIDELPSLDLPFSVADHHQIGGEKKAAENSTDLEDRIFIQHSNSSTNNNNNSNNNNSNASGGSCSSTSETSKGSELSLARSENRMKARERARLLLASKKEKDKKTDLTTGLNQNQVNIISENSSFTDLLTGGINTTTITTAAHSPIDYFFNRPPQIPQFNIMTGDNHHHFSLLQDSFLPTATTTFGGGGRGVELHNFNFLATSPSLSGGGVVAPGGFTRGTLQSNLQSPHHQRFQSSLVEGPSNLPFFIVPNATVDHFTATAGGYHLGYGGGGNDGGRDSDHHKEKSKN